MTDKYRIVSDGKTTRVYLPNGELLRSVSKVEFQQFAGGVIKATVELIIIAPEVDVLVGAKNG